MAAAAISSVCAQATTLRAYRSRSSRNLHGNGAAPRALTVAMSPSCMLKVQSRIAKAQHCRHQNDINADNVGGALCQNQAVADVTVRSQLDAVSVLASSLLAMCAESN